MGIATEIEVLVLLSSVVDQGDDDAAAECK
jgi:hypothetical protein